MVDSNGNSVKRSIIRATINGKVLIVDHVSADRNSYKDMGDSIEYLGIGKYHSYDMVRADDPIPFHFWRWREDVEGIKGLIRNLSNEGKESLWEWIKNPD